MQFAGSAIAQGRYVGRIDSKSAWRPSPIQQKWLLLSGATDPPKDVGISKRRPRDIPQLNGGGFLAGVTLDLVNMESAVGTKLFNTVKDLYLNKAAAFEHIRKLFHECKRTKTKPMLYYTGHGEIGTGNWCFADGTIGIEDIFDMIPKDGYYPMIFSDACYSGHWANFCINKNIVGFHCLAACPEYSTAMDNKETTDITYKGWIPEWIINLVRVCKCERTDAKIENTDCICHGGGDLTLYMTGKKLRPSTEPMFSGGNRTDFPISSGFGEVAYTDFISGHIQNSNRIVISQTMHNGRLSGCFAPSELYKSKCTCWGIRKNYELFLSMVNEKWKWVNGKSKQIYSLACDENIGFGVFFIENFGTSQIVVTDTSDIKKKWDDGFRITACAARGSTFYVIMTKDTEQYKRKQQMWFTRNTWNGGVHEEVRKGYADGYIMTGVCYSSGLGQYFVVMTGDKGNQCYLWAESGNRLEWMDEKYKEEFHPTILFKDPTDNMLLVVMTTDENRSGYVCKFNYKIA